jgi:hypothetical protein
MHSLHLARSTALVGNLNGFSDRSLEPSLEQVIAAGWAIELSKDLVLPDGTPILSADVPEVEIRLARRT